MHGHSISTTDSDERQQSPHQQQQQHPDYSTSTSYTSNERHSSSQSFQPGPRVSIPNVFSDEFSLEPLDTHTTSNQQSTLDSESSGRPSLDSMNMEEKGTRPPEKSPFADGQDSPIEGNSERPPVPSRVSSQNRTSTDSAPISRTSSPAFSIPQSTTSTAHRSLSTTSHFSIPRALSPYTGQTGASHPYAMYPQGIGVGRTSSISSNSTIRPPERNFVAAAAPQHPYAMYSQNTVPEEISEEPQIAPPIPLEIRENFPIYQGRQTNAPDELGDIVGPDGHTEQLPPYSRYPNGIPQKTDFNQNLAVTTGGAVAPDEPPVSPVSPVSGVSSRALSTDNAGGITNNPPNDPSNNPSNNPSAVPPNIISPDSSTTPAIPIIPTDPAISDTADGFKEKVAKKGKKKICCGIPIWIFVLIGVVLIFGGVLGGVTGGLLGAHQGEKKKEKELGPIATDKPFSTVTVTASTTLDAVPLASSVGYIPPAPTGDYKIPSKLISGKSNSCVSNEKFQDTWKCRTVGAFDCTISRNPDGSRMFSFITDPVNGTFFYGDQAPIITDVDFPLDIMQDKTAMSLGPALFFWAPFDKLVIIPEDEFPYISPMQRSVDEDDLLENMPDWSRKTVSQSGHKPWFCLWNNTLLEVFIYVNETSSAAATTTTRTTGYPIPPTTTTLRGSSPQNSDDQDDPLPTSVVLESRGDPNMYPLAIKLEQKRFADSGVPAYCQQMQVMDDGGISGPLGDPVTIREHDTAAGSGIPLDGTKPGGNTLARRDSPSDDGCFCQWFYD